MPLSNAPACHSDMVPPPRRIRLSLVVSILLGVLCGSAFTGDLSDELLNGRTVREWVRLLSSDDRGERISAIEAIADLGAEAKAIEKPIRVASGDPSWYVRVRAVQLLAAVGAPDSVTAILKALDDPEPEVRSTAAQELRRARVGAASAVEGLARLSRDTESSVRSAAAIGLGEYYGEGGAETLLRLTDDGDPRVRYIAMARLAEVAGGAASLDAARRHTEDSDLAVRVVSAGLLWRSLGEGESIVRTLRLGLDAPDPQSRRAALRAISRRPRDSAVFVPVIWRLARASDDYTRLEAIRALGVITRDDLSQCAAVLEFDRDRWAPARVAVLDVLRGGAAGCLIPEARIRGHLGDADMSVRLAAVRLLQSRWPPQPPECEAIITALTDPERDCRERALEVAMERRELEPELVAGLGAMLQREPSFRLRRMCDAILRRGASPGPRTPAESPHGRARRSVR